MTTAPYGSPIPGRVAFGHALRAEWTKLRTLRSCVYAAAAAVVLGLGMALLFSSATGEGYADLTAAGRADFDPTLSSLRGTTMFAQLAIGALGAIVITSEYTTGMIRTSLAVVPRRGRLCAAKAVLVGLVGLGLGMVISFLGFLLGQRSLAETGAPHVGIEDPNALRAVLGGACYFALVGLLSVALGFLLRSTAATVTLLIAVTVIIPYFFGPFLPGAVRLLWPTLAGTQMMAAAGGAQPWAGGGIMTAGVSALLATAFGVFRSRDA